MSPMLFLQELALLKQNSRPIDMSVPAAKELETVPVPRPENPHHRNSRQTKAAASAPTAEARPAPSLREELFQSILNGGAKSLEELLRIREEMFKKHDQRKVAPPRDWLKEVSAILDFKDNKTLTKAERIVLAQFCRAHQVPVVSRKQTNMYVGKEAEMLSDDHDARTFLSAEKELKFAKNKLSFKRFLFQAKDTMASVVAVARGTHHIVGVCLEHQCLLTSRQPIHYQIPMRKRARKHVDEPKAKKQRTTPAEEQAVPCPSCPSDDDAMSQDESQDECHSEEKSLEEMANDLEALLWDLPESH